MPDGFLDFPIPKKRVVAVGWWNKATGGEMHIHWTPPDALSVDCSAMAGEHAEAKGASAHAASEGQYGAPLPSDDPHDREPDDGAQPGWTVDPDPEPTAEDYGGDWLYR